ncbi:hypothetical protein K2173_005685 [Erythroxylum novogranatense]|uniref:Uncharacterized protein n=1 Tax=Erythroxylum novogranatense TaxID=1862640 RepID=A0AAV8SRB8_9ROSI|nr:hypothetical protein K2173_005685 [Erythroxylum novogranatense]
MYRDNLSTQSAAITPWTRQEDKKFEDALVSFPEDVANRWQIIAQQVGKSIGEVLEHYNALVHDVEKIDSGRVELPAYADDLSPDSDWDLGSGRISFSSSAEIGNLGKNPDRKKGNPWSEEEHRLFLIGLQKYGKGDWRSISRNVVMTRTPTQVASHAQKYFLRHSAVKKERKRSSIHDITSVDTSPITVPVDDNWAPCPAAPLQQSSILQQMHPACCMPIGSHMPNQGPP